MLIYLPHYHTGWRLKGLVALLALALLAACGGGGGGGGGSGTGSAVPARQLLGDAPGDSQGTVGQPLGSVPGVRLVDSNGIAVPGVVVNFRAEPAGTVSPASVTTDAEGRARPQSWVLGTNAGVNALVATATGSAERRFLVTANPGPPSQLLAASAAAQSATAGAAVAAPPSVRVNDSFGNPVAGVPVSFNVEQGGGSVSGSPAVTVGNGIATLGAWTLGTVPGPNAVQAAVSGAGSVTFTAQGLDALAISIDSVQLNQSMQNTDGSLPAVAGRPGLLRILLRADRANVETPDVRVRLFRDGVQEWERILPARVVGVPTNPAIWVENQTWNIELDAAEVQPGIAIEAVADPQQTITLANRDATRFPRGGGQATLDVRELAPLELRFIRIEASRNGGAVANITNNSLDAFTSSTRRWLPVGGMQASLRSANFVTDLNLTSEDNVSQLLGDLRTLRIAEATGREYFHGIMPTINGLPVAGMAYLIPTPGNLTARVGLSYDRLPDGSDTVAHELGHNMGRRHAPCNDPGGLDPNFPYADGGIGQAGYDIDSRVLRGPGGVFDFMGYCRPRWISDYNYSAILDWRRSDPTAFQPVLGEPDPLADVLGQPGPGVLIWGRVSEGGVELNPVFSLEARPVLPEAEGTHAVRGFAADGALLFALSFAGEAVPHASDPSERHFGFFVPLAPAQIARLERVELVSPHGAATQASTGEHAAVPADRPATARIAVNEERLPDGGLRLRWDAASSPMAMVRDRHSGAVLGIGRSGELHFSAESLAGAVPEILLSDGVRTAPRFPVEER
jgi:hypothetical protein